MLHPLEFCLTDISLAASCLVSLRCIRAFKLLLTLREYPTAVDLHSTGDARDGFYFEEAILLNAMCITIADVPFNNMRLFGQTLNTYILSCISDKMGSRIVSVALNHNCF